VNKTSCLRAQSAKPIGNIRENSQRLSNRQLRPLAGQKVKYTLKRRVTHGSRNKKWALLCFSKNTHHSDFHGYSFVLPGFIEKLGYKPVYSTKHQMRYLKEFFEHSENRLKTREHEYEIIFKFV